MTASEIGRVSFLRIFFIFLGKSFFAVEIPWKFDDTCVRNTVSVFYPILHETFSSSCGFALIEEINLFFKNLIIFTKFLRKVFL